jgi:hypothetical protein
VRNLHYVIEIILSRTVAQAMLASRSVVASYVLQFRTVEISYRDITTFPLLPPTPTISSSQSGHRALLKDLESWRPSALQRTLEDNDRRVTLI